MIRKWPFRRLVGEILREFNNDVKFQATAILTLQAASEAYITSIFEDANLSAIECKRV